MFRSHNPVFKRASKEEAYASDYVAATYGGVTAKIFIYLACTFVGAIGGLLLAVFFPNVFIVLITASSLMTFIFAIIAMMAPKLSKVFGILFCLMQGAVVGVLSVVYESIAGGVIISALISTFTVLLVTSTLFMTGAVKVNNRFLKFLLTVSISVILSQLILFVISLFTNVQFTFGWNLIASLVMIFVASLYLLMDMQHVVTIVEGGYPKEMEWFVAFGLVFTMIWIYIEMLPLMVEIIGNNN